MVSPMSVETLSSRSTALASFLQISMILVPGSSVAVGCDNRRSPGGFQRMLDNSDMGLSMEIKQMKLRRFIIIILGPPMEGRLCHMTAVIVSKKVEAIRYQGGFLISPQLLDSSVVNITKETRIVVRPKLVQGLHIRPAVY